MVSRRLRLCKADEFGCSRPSLVHQLVETVLSVGSRLAKYDRPSVDTVEKSLTVECDALSVAFHV